VGSKEQPHALWADTPLGSHKALSRLTDPDTSYAAAAFVAPHLNSLERIVYDRVFSGGSAGANLAEVMSVSGAQKVSLSPRFAALGKLGLIVKTSIRRPGTNPRISQQCWVAAEFYDPKTMAVGVIECARS
jgi:hypothetical protein